jgi:hypothetical protein
VLPVLGVPIPSGALNGLDALYSIVQMPPGIPVGCLAVGNPGATNAALMAVSILSGKYPELRNKLIEYREKTGKENFRDKSSRRYISTNTNITLKNQLDLSFISNYRPSIGHKIIRRFIKYLNHSLYELCNSAEQNKGNINAFAKIPGTQSGFWRFLLNYVALTFFLCHYRV